jgi:uncharacterized membrane protein YgcG
MNQSSNPPFNLLLDFLFGADLLDRSHQRSTLLGQHMTDKSRLFRPLASGLLAASLFASAAFAQTDMTQETISRLQALGYTEFQVSRTFFGRVKISALSDDMAREVVMNQHTGEILREVDMTARIAEMRAMMAEQNGGAMGGNGGSGTGGNSGGMGGNGGNSGGMGGGMGG